MRRLSPELEALLPRIKPELFTQETSAREQDLSTDTHINMMELNGTWKLVGWALADDVMPRDMCFYVIMCERDDERYWCHVAHISLLKIIDKVKKDPKKIASL